MSITNAKQNSDVFLFGFDIHAQNVMQDEI